MVPLDQAKQARFGLLCVLLVFGFDMVLLASDGFVGTLPGYALYPLWQLSKQVSVWDAEAGMALNILTGYWGRFLLLILAWPGIARLRPSASS